MAKARAKTVMLTARVNGEILRSVREVARAADVSVTYLVEQALRQWLSQFIRAKRVS